MSPPFNFMWPRREKSSSLSPSKNSSKLRCWSRMTCQKISAKKWRKMDSRLCLRGQKMQPLLLDTRIWLRSTIEISIILLTKTGATFQKGNLRVHWVSGSNLSGLWWNSIFCKAMISKLYCWRRSFQVSIHQELKKWTSQIFCQSHGTVSLYSET